MLMNETDKAELVCKFVYCGVNEMDVKKENIMKIGSCLEQLWNDGVREGEREGTSKSKWVLLPIGGIERLTCDCCYKTVKQQDMHICRTNGSMKVVCKKCWEEVEGK